MRTAFFVTLTLLALAPPQGDACAVPVFRYALERWQPSRYPVHVLHRGLTPDQRRVLALLDGGGANVSVTTIDVGGKLTDDQRALWQAHAKATLPHVVVGYPDEEPGGPPAWAGPLEDAAVRGLLDSPARRRVVEYLAQGDSAVWVLVGGKDAKADEVAAKLLHHELIRLSAQILLPEPGKDEILATHLPLRVSFPIVRVSRADPAEAAFVRQLLGTEPKLDAVAGPIAVPVFGRGRALYALHGKHLGPAQIERWASFLCGACSCQVKELNPGVDLLLTADWREALQLDDPPPPTPAVTPPAPVIPPGLPPVVTPRPPRQASRWWLVGGLAAFGGLLAAAWVLRAKHRNGPPDRAVERPR